MYHVVKIVYQLIFSRDTADIIIIKLLCSRKDKKVKLGGRRYRWRMEWECTESALQERMML